MRGIVAKEIFCPRCRELHLAGSDTPRWLWVTCENLRYELPEEQGRLGTPASVEVARLGLAHTTGCMGCGQTARATDIDEQGLTHYNCYHCGESGVYAVTYYERSPAAPPPTKYPIPSALPAPQERSAPTGPLARRWIALTEWMEN